MPKPPAIPLDYIKACDRKTPEMMDLLGQFAPALEEAFIETNNRAHGFTLSHYDAINAATDAERILEQKGVPQSLRHGCTYRVASAGPTASAYRYAATGTAFTLTRTKSGSWRLDHVLRIEVWPRQKGKATLVVTPAARDAIINHAMAGIGVWPDPSPHKED